MAASLSGLLKPWTPRLLQVRFMRYNPFYLEPDYNKETYGRLEAELSAEEKQQRHLKTLQPIKAAKNSVSSSVFHDPLLSKFTNMLMKKGEKILAREIVAETLEQVKRIQVEKYHKASAEEKGKIECNPYTIFHQAVANCKPVVGLTSIDKGSRSYQVPVPLSDKRRRFLALKWMINECRENKHRRTSMSEKLAAELLAAFVEEGPVIKRKLDLHKMAEANRAYAHFRWG